MQITNINNNIIHIKSEGKSSSFKSGTQIKATVSQINSDGTVVLESDQGVFTASNTSNFGLRAGDTVALLVTEPSHDGSAATTAITQINGQPIDQNVSLSELHLIDLGIIPNVTNMRLYNILNRYQLPLTREFMLNLKEVFSSLPNITDEQAAFLAANNIKPTIENLYALTNVSSFHKDISSLLQESMQQIASGYGLSKSSIESILNMLSSLSSDTGTISNETANVNSGNLTQSMSSALADAVLNSAVINQTADTALFIGDNNKVHLTMAGYALFTMDTQGIKNESALNLAPKISDAIVSSVLNQISASSKVTLKSISELQLPKVPKDLAQTIAVLPEESQQEIAQMMSRMFQSSKEFLSVKLLSFIEQRLNVPVSKETSGEALRSSLKNMGSNINSILMDESSAAAQKTITTLKLNDSTMNFVQIPIQINDFKSTAEIYIVKRDAQKQLSLENGVKIIFALNTENLGRIESIISANTKDLSLNIRVEDSDIQAAVQREISYLKTLLSATNFNLSVLKVTMIDKKVSVLNAHTFFGYKQLDITI